jgi:formiminoglutamase
VTSSTPLANLLATSHLPKQKFRSEMLGNHITVAGLSDECAWHECIAGRFVLLGVPDDRGVEFNQGFVGAQAGPEAFRHAFYKLYDSRCADGRGLGEKWLDVGDLVLQPTIEETHQALSDVVSFLLLHGARRVHVVGGGHDFSFGSYWGHTRACSGVLPIVNFDAHLDLRPVEQNVINSGTPFRRVIEHLSGHIAGGHALFEVGIQRERNPQSLWDYAASRGVSVAEYTALSGGWNFHRCPRIENCALEEQLKLWIERWTSPPSASGALHLSIDLDVFPFSSAPGTSASTSFGVPVETLWPCMEDVLSREICRVVDVAELCPARDVQSQTARLAAALVFRGALSLESGGRSLVRDPFLG